MMKLSLLVLNVVVVLREVLMLVLLQPAIFHTHFRQLRRMNIRGCMIISRVEKSMLKLKEVEERVVLLIGMRMTKLIITLKVSFWELKNIVQNLA